MSSIGLIVNCSECPCHEKSGRSEGLTGYSTSIPRQRVTLAGLDFDPLDHDRTANILLSSFESGLGGRMIFVNVDVALRVERRPELADVIVRADLVLADGMPLVWTSRLQRTPLPERVAGSSMLIMLCRLAAEKNIGVLLIGGRPGSGESAVQRLSEANPGLHISWFTPPYGFEDNPTQCAEIDATIQAFGRCLCFVGLGFPKQERLMQILNDRFPECWFIATGGSIDFVAEGSRAPSWMQKSGLEWLHRLGREPKRLGRRYLVDDLPFALKLLMTSAWRRRPKDSAAPRGPET
jgi:N-acetylglucosaminyldiphosphoundecaprenol N-acetyl-beta-D-mannosaminyltransferase